MHCNPLSCFRSGQNRTTFRRGQRTNLNKTDDITSQDFLLLEHIRMNPVEKHKSETPIKSGLSKHLKIPSAVGII